MPAAAPESHGTAPSSGRRPLPHRRGVSHRRGMTHRRGLSLLTWIGAMAVVAGTAGTAYYIYGNADKSFSSKGLLTATVMKGRFLHEAVEKGELESSNNVDIRCEVKSKTGSGTATTILFIVPPGTQVTAGERLIEFDSSSLRAEETQQTILTEQARANLTQALLLFETAQIAVEEYLEGTFLQELQIVEGEIVVAEENLRRAQDYARYSQKLALKGYVTGVQLEADQFAVKNAELALATAQTKKKVLREFTKPKMLKTLESEVTSKEALMLAQKAAVGLEEKKLTDIRDQIKKCIVLSPGSGQVVYANESDRRGNPEMVIAEGVAVRERQVILRLPDPSRMQVRAKVKEGRISLVRPGQPAIIRVDALKERPLQGRVIAVDPVALPSFFSSIKEYAAIVEILDPPGDLMPTMSAEVVIVVHEIADCLQVPVQAVVERNNKHYVCLPGEKGLIAQPVVVGANNDQFVEVKSGLDAGQTVVLNAETQLQDLLPPQQLEQNSYPTAGPSTRSPRAPGPVGTGAPGTQAPGVPATGAPVPGAPIAGAPIPGGQVAGGGRPNPAEMIRRLDKDGDSRISREEAADIPADRFDRMDKDGDGSLTLTELNAPRPPRPAVGEGAGS